MPADDIEQRNIELTRRFIHEAFTGGDEAVCDDLVASDVIEHQRGLKPGRAGVKATIGTLHTWFSDFELRIEDLVADGDKVWIRARGTGVNTGPIMGNPPTGRRSDITVFDVLRWEDGKLVEHWGVPDQLDLLRQLGLFGRPKPEGASPAEQRNATVEAVA